MAVTSGAASVITQFAFERKVDAKQLAVDVGAGAVYGAIRFSPFGRITSTVLGFVTGGAQSIASDRAANKKSSPLVHLWNAAAGAVSTYRSWLPYRALSDPSFYSKLYKYPLDLTDPTRVNKVVFYIVDCELRDGLKSSVKGSFVQKILEYAGKLIAKAARSVFNKHRSVEITA